MSAIDFTEFVARLATLSGQAILPFFRARHTTEDKSGSGVFVPADQDFGGALEILKTASVQKLRYMGETPVRPGLYIRVTARVKAVSGPLPGVRIAAWAATG